MNRRSKGEVPENIFDDEDLQQQKLKEVEELTIKVNGGWKCRQCRKTFPDKGGIRRHAEIHVSGLSYPCDHCSKIFRNRASLYGHRRKYKKKVKL